MKEWIVTTKKPEIPPGFRKYKFCTGGYKKTILGKTVQNINPVWAERRTDKNAIFKSDRVFYRLYTYVDYPV
jgi:hypothetical protein